MGGCFLLSFILLLWLSPDSFMMHTAAARCDSAWFFTCGKAWMEGMVPYVDFADSKGLLLWLIYGLGYLLSPSSYMGVFWMSVASYSVVFHFVWKTSRLFLGRRESVFVLAMMPLFLFLRPFHGEVRAEDFCYPFIFAGFYFICLVLKCPSLQVVRIGAFWLGMGMVACLLIKWTTFLAMGGMALLMVGVSLRQRSAVGLLFGLVGMAVGLLPFGIYFLLTGNFGNFLQEYFLTTFAITGNSPIPTSRMGLFVILSVCIIVVAYWLRKRDVGGRMYAFVGLVAMLMPKIVLFIGEKTVWVIQLVHPMPTDISEKAITDLWTRVYCLVISMTDFSSLSNFTLGNISFAAVYIGIVLFCRRFKMSYWLLFVFMPFYMLVELWSVYNYYYTIATPFYLFLVIYESKALCEGLVRKLNVKKQMVVAVLIGCVCTMVNIRKGQFFFVRNERIEEKERVMREIAKMQYPKIVWIGMDHGEGLYARSLPGCKYWARQNGATQEMIDERNHAIRTGKPDFVIVDGANEPDVFDMLKRSGYKICCKYTTQAGVENWLYAKLAR